MNRVLLEDSIDNVVGSAILRPLVHVGDVVGPSYATLVQHPKILQILCDRFIRRDQPNDVLACNPMPVDLDIPLERVGNAILKHVDNQLPCVDRALAAADAGD